MYDEEGEDEGDAAGTTGNGGEKRLSADKTRQVGDIEFGEDKSLLGCMKGEGRMEW